MLRLAAMTGAMLIASSATAQSGFPIRDATGRPPSASPAPPAPTVPAWRPGLPGPGHPGPGHPGPGRPPHWRPPVTVIYGNVPDQFIPWPFQFNLPNPPYGMVWMRSNNDAVLFDRVNRTIVQVRSRWFG